MEAQANGSISERAASAAVEMARQRRHDDRGVGLTGLYDGIERALKDIPPVILNDASAFKRFNYASLKRVVSVVRQPLLTHGVIIQQGSRSPFNMDGTVFVPIYTDLKHVRTGEVDRTEVYIPLGKKDPQSMGSLITYGKRYSLLAALGLATDDDDDARAAQPNQWNGMPAAVEELIEGLRECASVDALTKWRNDPKNDKVIKGLAEDDFERIKVAFMDHRETLSKEPAKAKK